MFDDYIRLVGSTILFAVSVILPIGIELLLEQPTEEWLNMSWYYVVIGAVCYLALILIWALPTRGKKSKEENLIEKVEELISEIRQERIERTNNPKH